MPIGEFFATNALPPGHGSAALAGMSIFDDPGLYGRLYAGEYEGDIAANADPAVVRTARMGLPWFVNPHAALGMKGHLVVQ